MQDEVKEQLPHIFIVCSLENCMISAFSRYKQYQSFIWCLLSKHFQIHYIPMVSNDRYWENIYGHMVGEWRS